MNKSFVHQSKAQVLWLKFVYTIFGTEVLGCCTKIFKKGCLTKIFKILHLTTPFKEISTQRMKITQIPQYTTRICQQENIIPSS